jgi:DNA-binding transcriptional LysR family regulator
MAVMAGNAAQISSEMPAKINFLRPVASMARVVRLQTAVQGIGIALLPEQVISAPLKERLVERVLPEWSGARNILHLVYPTPRGMLPSVRSLIDYLLIHVPAWLRERSI